MTPRKTWWVARDKHERNGYVLSREKPYWRNTQEYTTEAGGYFYRKDALILCAANWHRAGGLRLKPGEGPIKVTLELKVRRIK